MGGGVLQALGPHIIDIITLLVGQKCTTVHGSLSTFVQRKSTMHAHRRITSDDFCCFQMKFQSGLIATVNINSHLPSGFEQEAMIVGRRGYVKVVNCDLYEQKVGDDQAVECLYKEVQDIDPDNERRGPMPSMYLHGLERMIKDVKCAFESMQTTDQHSPSPDR